MERKRWVVVPVAFAVCAALASSPVVARTVVDFARNAGRLDGKDSSVFAQRCRDGSVVGWAQVGQGTDEYIKVPGFTYIRDFRRCEKQAVFAKGAGEGGYLVRFGEKGCSNEVFPPAPLVVTVAHSDGSPDIPLTASYSTICDNGIYAFKIILRDSTGTPRNGTFTAHLLQLP